MDSISVKHETPDDDSAFLEKLHDQIQKMMDRTSVIHPPTKIPYPLPPFKPDDTDLEKLDWIVPPIPVKPKEEMKNEDH